MVFSGKHGVSDAERARSQRFKVDIELDADQVGRCIDEVGLGFMFAPRHHAATAHVVPAREALGVGT